MSELRGSISPTLLRRQPAEVYKIKIGRLGEERKKSSGDGTYRLPQKLDHFLVTRREREGGDRDANFVRADAVHQKIGDEPTELSVRLMFDEPEDNFFSQMQRYEGRDRVRECDGETARDPRNDTTSECRHPECSCKPYGRLQVILEAAPTFGSVAVFRTTSWETVRNIQTTLELLYEQFGFLAGLPLLLRIYPATDTYQQGGNSRSSTSYKVALELRGDFEDARDIALEAHKKRLRVGKDMKLLAEARAEELARMDDEDADELVEEFHPDPNARADVETAERVEDIKRRAEIEAAAEEEPSEADSDSEAETSSRSPEPETEPGDGAYDPEPEVEEPEDRPMKRAVWMWFQDAYGDKKKAEQRWATLSLVHPDFRSNPARWTEDECEEALAWLNEHGREGVERIVTDGSEQVEAL